MDYEAIDREMSRWLVTCVKNDTRFFLTDDGMATDILSRARRFNYMDQAENTARLACAEAAWSGFAWTPISRPAV